MCNARPPTHLPYYTAGVNSGASEEESSKPAESASDRPFNFIGRNLANLSDAELLQLIQHVKKYAGGKNQLIYIIYIYFLSHLMFNI